MKFFLQYTIYVAVLLVLKSCNTTKQMIIPGLNQSEVFENIPDTKKSSTFALAKLINDIPRGEPLFAFPSKVNTDGWYCNYSYSGDNTVTSEGSRQYLGDWSSEIGVGFYETLAKKGYSVVGDPSDLFNQRNFAKSAEYLIGGRIIKMSGNFCEEHHWWDGRPLNKFSGEIYTEIEWSVLNSLTKNIVIKEKIQGYYKQNKPVKDGVILTFKNAILHSADNFASTQNLRKLAIGEKIESLKSSKNVNKNYIRNGKSSSFDFENLKSKIVTIRIGTGHGSGFFIGTDGFILTNAHVIGEAKKVQIVTTSGIEFEANSIFVNKIRDVALLKSNINFSEPLDISLETPKITTEVYAVGTPISENLKATVTKGIISAVRVDKTSDLEFIQADVSISPGNSGGPLFNSKGKVIGISAAKYLGDGVEGLGLFIPIKEALETLNVEIL